MVTPATPRPSPAQDWARAMAASALVLRRPDVTLADLVAEQAAAGGDRVALLGIDGVRTYADLAAGIARYARWGRALDLGPGGRIALLMPNDLDYVAIWLGLTRAGLVVALVNANLVGASLAHAVAVSEASHVIVAAALTPALAEALTGDPVRRGIWHHGGGDGPRVDIAAAVLSGADLTGQEWPPPASHETALLIFTSGTTGLPKAARVSHRRILEWSLWFAGLLDITPEDRMYLCLPMFHSVGGVVATGAPLARGGSVVIRERFSASRFWPDVAATGATLFQYIGEVCRYLVAAPPDPAEANHRLRLCVGNGLGEATWRAFARRFPDLRVLEFYASTEGNLSLYNVEGEVGAVGRVPPLLAARFPLLLIRLDPCTGEPRRGADGLCLPCEPDEPGEALGLIASDAEPGGRPFEGYTGDEDTARKTLRDVRSRGDRWFRTGDLMRRDARGFVCFVERIGDTFRWKGENVATGEVSAVLHAVPGVIDAAVFGIAVPGHEGRAGMAVLATISDFAMDDLPRLLAAQLPPAAVPVFIRIVPTIPVTGTYKHAVGDLRARGFDPGQSTDPLYVMDRKQCRYLRLDRALYEIIQGGRRAL